MANVSNNNDASARRIVGLILVVAAPTLALAVWRSTHGPLEALAGYERHRTPADSIAYVTAQYHAEHARGIEAARWHLTGYATLGLLGTVIGAGLILSGSYRRTT